MRLRYSVEGVVVFTAVAEAGSFSAAARRLGVSPSAVSQIINSLEQRLGTPLFRRSTRSLSLTDVGHDYLASVAPALAQLDRAADEASGAGAQPAGSLRLTMPRAPFERLVAPRLVAFHQAYPRVHLEIAVEARLVDIVKEGYDAGLRYGKHLEKDMVAVLLAPRSQAVLAASPAYLASPAAPAVPADLADHHCLVCRSQGTGMIIPWSLQSVSAEASVSFRSTTVVHDLASQVELAVRGLGIVNAPLELISAYLDNGSLVRVLPAWWQPLDEVYLYFPSRRHQSPAMRAFIAAVQQNPPPPH